MQDAEEFRSVRDLSQERKVNEMLECDEVDFDGRRRARECAAVTLQRQAC